MKIDKDLFEAVYNALLTVTIILVLCSAFLKSFNQNNVISAIIGTYLFSIVAINVYLYYMHNQTDSIMWAVVYNLMNFIFLWGVAFPRKKRSIALS